MSPKVEPSALTRFENSLHRCLAQPSFLERFYQRFLASDPEVAEKFARTDFGKQTRVMRASLYLVLRAAAGHDDGLSHLGEVKRTHGDRALMIPERLYRIWLDTLIAVAEEVDGDFDADTRQAWRDTLEPCIAVLIGR